MSQNKIILKPSDTFGRLTVIQEVMPRSTASGNKIRRIQCRCNCGNIVEVDLYELVRQNRSVQSCGCLNKEKNAQRFAQMNQDPNLRQKHHGTKLRTDLTDNELQNIKNRQRLQNILRCMKKRCYNPEADSYKYYGAKGIIICKEWLDNTNNFIEWALSHGYAENLTIDRYDNNAGYSPENCHWTTNKFQMNHTSKNIKIPNRNGEYHTPSEWIDIYNLHEFSADLIRCRFYRHPKAYIEDLIYPKHSQYHK